MTFAVVYAKDSVDDIDAAFDWLATRVPASAAGLLRAIDRAEIHLKRNPAIYKVVRNNPSGDTQGQPATFSVSALLSGRRF